MAGFPTGTVNGFGWKNITILSAGLQYQVSQKFPVRVGYTYSSNPIPDKLAFFSIPATAVIENAAQIGFGYKVNDAWNLDFVYHQGFRGEGSEGSILSPAAITPTNPLGAIPGTTVSYDMETSLVQVSVTYSFDKTTKQ